MYHVTYTPCNIDNMVLLSKTQFDDLLRKVGKYFAGRYEMYYAISITRFYYRNTNLTTYDTKLVNMLQGTIKIFGSIMYIRI